MNITQGQGYKLVEADGHLSIIPTDFNLAEAHQPLVIADKAKLCDYLMAYLDNREQGKSLKEAHHYAMQFIGVQIVSH